jgi:stalled ribosome alternative rescue factor ArfA
MWSSDIYSMTSERSIEFYEQLRLNTDTRNEINTAQVGIKWFKELFNIPKEGKGSYMREKGGFNRAEFERKVIEPLCDDLAKCKMINLVLQPNGKYYEKVKQNGRVVAYRFDWTYTSHPRVGTAIEIQNVQNEIEKNPEILKVAKDIIKGTKKKNKFNSFENQNKYNMDELESQILAN